MLEIHAVRREVLMSVGNLVHKHSYLDAEA